MNEKNGNRQRLKESFLKYGILYLLVGIGLILTYYCINHIPVIRAGVNKINGILMPFYMGLILAYLLCPVYNAVVRLVYRANHGRLKSRVKELRLAKLVATVVSLAVIVSVIAGFFVMIGPDLWDSLTKLFMGVPDAVDKVQAWINLHITKNPEIVNMLQTKLEDLSNAAIQWAQQKLLPGAGAILTGVVGTLGMVTDFFVALIICVYIWNSKETFIAQEKKLILAVFRPQTAGKIFRLGKVCNETFGGFINGKIIDSVIIGVMCFTAMSVMKLPMAILISVVVGVTNIIPFFGPFIGAAPSILILLIIEPMAALKFAIMVLVLQQLDGNIIGPKILGKTTKLASFWVMFAIIVGGGMFGIPGMILGVPVFAVLYTYTAGAINTRLKAKNLPTDTLLYEEFHKYKIDKEELFGADRFKKERKHEDENSDNVPQA